MSLFHTICKVRSSRAQVRRRESWCLSQFHAALWDLVSIALSVCPTLMVMVSLGRGENQELMRVICKGFEATGLTATQIREEEEVRGESVHSFLS